MQKKIKGIVLNTTKYGDFDKLVTILTDEGKMFFKARGIRSITSKNAAGCKEFCYSEFILESRGDKSFLIKCQPLYQTLSNGCDIETLSLASYFSQMCEDTALDAETASQALKLLINALFIISKNDRPLDLIKAVFEMRLLAVHGFFPLFDSCCVCGEVPLKNGKTFFNFVDGTFICPDCIENRGENTVSVSEAVFELMKRSVSLPDDKAYAVAVPDEVLKHFSFAAEKFSISQYDKKYKTLDFYKEVKKLSSESTNQ